MSGPLEGGKGLVRGGAGWGFVRGPPTPKQMNNDIKREPRVEGNNHVSLGLDKAMAQTCAFPTASDTPHHK